MKPLWLVGALALAVLLLVRRRKLEPTLLIGGVLAVTGSLLYGFGLVAFPDLEKLLKELGGRLGSWTYLLVGGLAFLETGAFVGLLAPGETTILVGGVVAGQGEIDIVALVALVWVCAVAGDLTSFYLGRRLGRGFLEQHGGRVSITPERLVKVEDFFEKHGGKAILLGRFVGLIRAIAPFLAGSSGMPLRRFLPYDVIGAGLWGATFCMLGYLFWQSFGTVLDYAKTGALALGSTIVVVTAVVVLVRLVRVPANRDRVVAWVCAQERRPVIGPVVRLGRQPARFALRRVTPGDLGLELTTLLAIGAVGAFAVVGYATILGPGELTPGDVRGLRIADELRTDWVTEAAKVVSQAGLLSVTLAAVAIACIALAVRREVLEAAAIASGYALMLLAEQLLAGPGNLVIDLSGLSFIDSAGLAVLIAADKGMRRAGTRLVLAAPRAPVDKVLRLTGLSAVLTTAPTVEERRAWVLAVLIFGSSAREGFTSAASQLGLAPPAFGA